VACHDVRMGEVKKGDYAAAIAQFEEVLAARQKVLDLARNRVAASMVPPS